MSCDFGRLSLFVFVAAVQVNPLCFSFQVEECFIDKFAVVCTYVSSKRLCSKNYNSRDFDRGIYNHLACLCCENVLFHTETSFKLVFPVVSETGLFWSPFSVQH